MTENAVAAQVECSRGAARSGPPLSFRGRTGRRQCRFGDDVGQRVPAGRQSARVSTSRSDARYSARGRPRRMDRDLLNRPLLAAALAIVALVGCGDDDHAAPIVTTGLSTEQGGLIGDICGFPGDPANRVSAERSRWSSPAPVDRG
jgi:hypothetical protein